MKVTVDPDDLDLIKTLVRSSPDYTDGEFRWPFSSEDNVTTFTSKETLGTEFEFVYDARQVDDLDNITNEHKMPASQLENGCRVAVEFTPTTYSPWKSLKDGEAPAFLNGCSLKLHSVILIEETRLNFDSPRKRRRMK